jgi:hypothetical protein
MTCRRNPMRAAFLFLHAGAVSLMPTTKETAMNPNKPKSLIEADASTIEAGVSPSPGTGNRTRAFEGFPYLATRLVSLLHHIVLLPRSWQPEQLLGIARRQAQANCLPTCLVLAGDVCVYFGEDGGAYRSAEIPCGAYVVSKKLAPAEPIPESAELAERQRELVLFEEAQRGNLGTGYLLGDLTKGGRPPTPDEEDRLAGTHAGGIPRGLLPCLVCGEWRGNCFDTTHRELIVRVCCTCENDNRCARCDGLLYSRKLNANYFDLSDLKIWHVPGFSGLDHRCPKKYGDRLRCPKR